MKFERIAKAALLAMLVSACSGDEPAQDAAPATTQPAPAGIESTVPAAPETTISAPTTTAPVVEPPQSLAFASSRDIGRLFEITGTQTAYTNADRDISLSSIESGTLVQATSARNTDDGLAVQVRDASSKESLGWLSADALLPTTRFAVTEDPAQSGELRIARRSSAPLPIVRTPGGSDVAANLASEEIAMHGGATALAANGETYRDVLDPTSRTRIGWIESSSFGAITSIRAMNQDHQSVRSRPDSSVDYGAPLQAVSIVQTGCNATQLQFVNPSITLGLAVVVGQSVPTGRTIGSAERWSSSGGGTLYVAPGDSATVTVLTDSARAWYFADLDEDLRATTSRGADGSLVSEPATATNVQQVEVAAGSCTPPPATEFSVEADIDSGDEGALEAFPPEERAAAIERFNRTGSFDLEEPELEDELEGEGSADDPQQSSTEQDGETTTTTTDAPTTTTAEAAQ